MNKIEEQIKKFEKMKQKIPNIDISNLIKVKKQFSNSLLNYLIQKKSNCSPKKQTNDIFTSNHPITENPTEQRQKEKNKFITQKADEKGKSKTQQGKSHGNNNDQGQNNKGNANKDMESSLGQINLLKIENDNMARPELKKMFEKKREEEEKINKEKKINQEKEAGKEEKNPEKEEEKKEEKEKEENQDMSIEEDEKEKKEEPKENENEIIVDNHNNNNLNFHAMESGINIPMNFNIFDDYKIKEEEYDDIGHIDYKEERNKESYYKNDINEEKINNLDMIKDENKEINEEKEEKKNEDKEKEEEKKEEENIPIPENENKSNSLKICISLEEEGEKDKKDKIFLKPIPENKIPKLNSNKKNIPEKLLQNKTKRSIPKEIKKSTNTNTNKNENNIIISKNLIATKSKKKVITDDDEEEFTIKEKNNTKNISNKKKEEEPIIKTKGSKFQLLFGPEEIKNAKGNDLNDDNNNKSNKKNNQQNEIKINIEMENENKIKNNKNLVNKNKNGSQNNSTKNSIIYNNYDLSCLDNIHGILIQIEERLNRENIEKNKIKSCFELIENIKKNDIYINNNNLIKRKKDTYINVYKILKILFKFFGEKKIAKNYNNEIVALLTIVENYYKSIKKNDNSINNMDFYYKRKTAFKYVFSKLELKNCEKGNLKKLYAINEDNSNDNNIITDNKNAIKFIKTFKRYTKTSSTMYQELKKFKEKLNNYTKTNNIKEFLDKYEYCGADIQMSPHLMGYNRLFSHFGLIFSFYNDSNNKNLLNELEEQQKKKESNHVNDIRKKGKSVQVSKNGIKERRDSSVNNVKKKNEKNK